MTQILLVRHAVNDFVKTGRLAGWTAGVHLNAEGQQQAAALAERLAKAPIQRLYSSPLERTVETAEAIHAYHPDLDVRVLEALGEVRVGDWQGEELKVVSQLPVWKVVQQNPSRFTFPNGESFRQAQARAVDAIEDLAVAHPEETIVVVSHADIIKLVLAHFLGMALDSFQRIVIAPASISVLALTESTPYVGAVNDIAHLRGLEPLPDQATPEGGK